MNKIFFVAILILGSHFIKVYASTPEKLVLDLVHHNPGEQLTKSMFCLSSKVATYGYTGQVINEYRFAHCAITYDSIDPEIFPNGSAGRKWVDSVAHTIDLQIEECHKAGLKAYYFTDIIVLPKALVAKYKPLLCDSLGKISFDKPFTQTVHRAMIREIFQRFPMLDGLMIRVGETYLNNVPYHIGNTAIPFKGNVNVETDGGEQIHIKLLNLLRDEVCVKQNKTLIYRTWDFGFLHTNPKYYLSVTNKVEPHTNLYFSIKHIAGDYHRCMQFNPTLGIGSHKQIVEVQCQREYEGKGAYPNYIAKGVIDGFEENANDTGAVCLNDIKQNKNFAGVNTWSRGGGWLGPYIKNELWCELNAFVVSKWAVNTTRSEQDIFNEFASLKGISDVDKFRQIALLSSKAVVRGQASLIYPCNVWWTRDQFIGGTNELKYDFKYIIDNKLVNKALDEKHQAVNLWKKIAHLGQNVECSDASVKDYIRVSTQYGFLLYSIFNESWQILLYGYESEKTNKNNSKQILEAYKRYQLNWKRYAELYQNNKQCATLYTPYYFVFEPPLYHDENGLEKSIQYFVEKAKKIQLSD